MANHVWAFQDHMQTGKDSCQAQLSDDIYGPDGPGEYGTGIASLPPDKFPIQTGFPPFYGIPMADSMADLRRTANKAPQPYEHLANQRQSYTV